MVDDAVEEDWLVDVAEVDEEDDVEDAEVADDEGAAVVASEVDETTEDDDRRMVVGTDVVVDEEDSEVIEVSWLDVELDNEVDIELGLVVELWESELDGEAEV